jgi:hypothetical protein
MRRGVAQYFVGSAVLLALVGCGRMAFEQREPWRREAEVACVRSGAVKSGNARVQISAINGPGMCGAEYPFKVAALGDRTILGYRDEMRPPAAVPQGFPIPEARRPAPAPMPTRAMEPAPATHDARPMPIHPPGTEPGDEEEPEPDAPEVDNAPPMRDAQRPAYPQQPAHPPADGGYRPHPSTALPTLGPNRGGVLTVSAATVQPAATLACPLVSRLDQWMASAVQPSAQRWFGQPVAEIKQISAYSCRGMNGNPRARISEHAFGNALDIAAFTLADGRRVTVKDGWRGSPEEQGFLRDVHAAACQHFSTVLAPGSNRYHYDHIHVDLARRRSGRNYCNPQPVSGDLIARRATDRTVTGSVGTGGRLGFAPEEQRGLAPKLPRAVPGED